MSACVIEGLSPRDVEARAPELAELFRQTGVLHLKGLFARDPILNAYVADIRRLAGDLLAREGVDRPDSDELLNDVVTRLYRTRGVLPRYLHDLCSYPGKLLSGLALKLHPAVTALIGESFGQDAVLATPTISDALSLFLPKDPFRKIVLPVHQDFPYMLQSPRQAIAWIPLSRRVGQMGGVEGWVGSHKGGIRPVLKDGNDAMVAQTDEAELAGYEQLPIDWDFGDLVLMDSLLLHRSIANTSEDQTRVIQIFRFSDLNSEDSLKHYWRSKEPSWPEGPDSRAQTFKDLYPDLHLG